MVYDPTSGLLRDTVRLMVGDTDDSNVIFSDDEYALVESEADGDKYAMAAFLLEALASSKARVAVMMKTLGESIDRKQVAKELREQAKIYQEKSDKDLTVMEVFLEDEEKTTFDAWGDQHYDYDTRNDELNN